MNEAEPAAAVEADRRHQDAGQPAGPPRSRRLDRALRIVDAGPAPFYRAAVVSLGLSSTLALVVSVSVRPPGALPGPQRDVIAFAVVALCLSAVLGLVSVALRGHACPAWLDRAVAPQERAGIWLALAAWMPFLVIVAYFRAEATFPQTVQWLYFGYLDKRWVSALYLLGTLGPMIALTAAARVLTVGRRHPRSWRAWFTGLFPRAVADPPDTGDSVADGTAAGEAGFTPAAEPAPPKPVPAQPVLRGWRQGRAGRILAVVAGLATALGLAWYFLGPPWYLSQNGSMISQQEDLFLTGFQAIAKGHLPYIGVAESQYGPGTQLASYLLMRHVTSFSVVGFRQAWALFTWVGASALFAVFFLAFGYIRGLAASLLSVLVYPSLQLIAFRPGGPFEGFWGWANPLRYVGMIALVLLLPAVVRRSPSRSGTAAGAAIGVLWGVTSYLAQENLIAGAVGALLVGALLLLSGTSLWRAVRAALASVLVGFLVVWLPVLAFYAVHGDLGRFLGPYFLLAHAMAEGFGNTWWQGATHKPSPLTTMFHVLPFLLAMIALLTVFQFRPIRVADRWSRERVRLAATLIITILLYQGALLRSDTADLTGTLLAVPALVVMTATAMPRLLGGRRRGTVTVVGAALAAASFALLPYQAFAWGSVRSAAEAPYLDRQHMAALPLPGTPATLAASRVGAGLNAASQCCEGSPERMASFIGLMNRIHSIVGDRMAHVASFPHADSGLVYFVANLTPAPALAEKHDTVLNVPQLRDYMAYFRTIALPHTQAVLTASLNAPEARFFLQRYPGARRIVLHYAGKPYYVLLRRG